MALSRTAGLRIQRELQPLLAKIGEKLPAWIRTDRKSVLTYFASALVLTAFIWCYRSGLADLWNLWRRSDEYSSGLLVPFLAVYILWSRRHAIAQCPVRPSMWGLLAFAGAQAVRLLGLFLMYGSAERASIVLSIAAIVLLLFGWPIFRKVFTVLLFLCLILPWPNIIQYSVGLHLQGWATSSAVFCLEMVGYEVIQEGNIIHIGATSVEVAYACNGLRMITAFFVISGLVVLLVNRAWWEKLIVLVSSLPIALLCNTVRLAVTAIALTRLSGQFWHDIFHDFGGYAMMPLALAAVVGELWLLTRLTAPPDAEQAVIIVQQKG
jgi:exosortase